ncbi:MAG: tetratricopeptide repeat protein [Bacteroidales bacterium]|nr:tetratricopeptide repeat protein [Bacteroidales bacterium]
MRRPVAYLLIALAVTTLLSCNANSDRDKDLTDSEKLEALDIRIEKHPNDATLHYERATLHMNMGRLKEANSDIERAVELKPDNLDYRLLQADICFAGGNVDDSYKALSEAEKIDPESIEVQLKMGEVTFYSRDYERSLRCLSNVTAKEPDNRTALFMKGFIYKEMGDTASAITLLRKVCDIYPDYSPAFEELGVIYSTHHSPMTVEYLNTAIQLDPNNTNAIYALALYYQDIQDFEQAESLYQRILDINEKSADTWHNLGYIELFHYRDYERAIEYMTKAIESDPNCIEAYVNRGCAYELSGQKKEARADFEAALSIDSQYEPAMEGLKRIK